MKRFIIFFVFLSVFSCSGVADKPKNLIEKKTMSEIIADLAITDQLSALQQQGSPQKQPQFILQSHGVDAKSFSDSYKYYISEPKDLEAIYNDAQDIIKDKNPEAADYIDKKLKENHGAMPPGK